VRWVPLTFPTHPAAVLPLKLRWPRLFDGVALVLGSMVPDLGYAFDGIDLGLWRLAHSWIGLFVWSLPLTLIGCVLVRRAAPAIAAHVPGAGDYAVLRTTRHPWWVTVSSTLVGAAGHLLLDDLETLSPAVVYAGHVAGFVTLPLLLRLISRRHLLLRWHGRPRTLPARSRFFWPTAALVAAGGLAAIPFLPGHVLLHTSGVRALLALALGLLAASRWVPAGTRTART
jgi:hypothetical protein